DRDCFAELVIGPATSGRRRTDWQPLLVFLLVFVISLDRTTELDRHWIAVTILGLAHFEPNPTFADAILADIGLLDALETYADVALERVRFVIRTARVVGQPVGRSVCRS